MKFKFQCLQIKFYWNTNTPIHLHIVSNLFQASDVGLISVAQILWPEKPKLLTSLSNLLQTVFNLCTKVMGSVTKGKVK